ncbi:methyltetrahydrofolate cobalamin methyltransferase [Deferrisoma sp.]
MIIVGELINASRKAIAPAIEARDAEAIAQVARDQREAGADYIDVNAGIFVGQEADYLRWLVETVQSAVDAPCCIDSPDPKAIEAALAVHKGPAPAMINSISLEKERYDALLPVVAGTDLRVVALCMSDEGMPETTDQRLAIADKLVNGLVQAGVPVGNIYVDPLVQPLSTRSDFGVEFLNAVEQIMARFPGIHTMCGLSNISYGLPERKLLNQTFMVMAIAKGLDGAIINPLDRRMMAQIIAAEALAGRDNYCMKYLKAYRAKRFENL